MSSSTFLIVLLSSFVTEFKEVLSATCATFRFECEERESTFFEFSFAFSPRRQTFSINLLEPIILSVFHTAVSSNGPTNISYTRSVSAPYVFTISSGFTTLPSDFDIFTPPSPNIIP